MPSVDDIVDVQNTISDVAPTRPSFGVPLLIGYHTRWLDKLTKLYSSAAEMLDDGFVVTDYLYQAMIVAKSQEPSPELVMIGRRTIALTQVVELVPTDTTQGHVYSGTINGQAFTYTVGASSTVAIICAALQLLIDAFTGCSCTNGTTKITVTCDTPGTVMDFATGPKLALTDVTADSSNTAAALAAIDAELDGQDTSWYGAVPCDSHSKATGLAVAAYIESVKKLSLVQTADAGTYDPASTTDVMYAMKAASYTRTGAAYHAYIGGTEWLAVGMLAGRLAVDPGAETWAFKTDAGVTVDTLTSAQKAAIAAKNGNVYVKSHGKPIFWEGKAASGRFFDSTRGIDWQTSTIDFDVFEKLSSVPKQGFNSKGLSAVGLTIEQSIQKGVVADLVDGIDVPPVVITPTFSSTSSADRAARLAKGFKYSYRLTGALHGVQVRGTINV
jgi:hypothetical protein